MWKRAIRRLSQADQIAPPYAPIVAPEAAIFAGLCLGHGDAFGRRGDPVGTGGLHPAREWPRPFLER
jgi:hypothetical protein